MKNSQNASNQGNRIEYVFYNESKDKRCIRKSFAPAIGIEFEEVEDCVRFQILETQF